MSFFYTWYFQSGALSGCAKRFLFVRSLIWFGLNANMWGVFSKRSFVRMREATPASWALSKASDPLLICKVYDQCEGWSGCAKWLLLREISHQIWTYCWKWCVHIFKAEGCQDARSDSCSWDLSSNLDLLLKWCVHIFKAEGCQDARSDSCLWDSGIELSSIFKYVLYYFHEGW